MSEMTFLQHLKELKGIVVRIGIAFFILAILNLYSAGFVLQWFSDNFSIVSLKPYDSINALLVIDLVLTIAMVFPLAVFFVFSLHFSSD